MSLASSQSTEQFVLRDNVVDESRDELRLGTAQGQLPTTESLLELGDRQLLQLLTARSGRGHVSASVEVSVLAVG